MPKKILIVDDDEAICKMLVRLLSRYGYETSVANNGNEGLKKCAVVNFDLIITDIIMPDMEGIEFIITLKRKYPEINVIAMSGGGYLAPQEYLDTAKDFGVIDTFTKPFNIKTLIAKINETLS